MNTTVRIALKLIPDSLQTQSVFLRLDDTMVSKFGTKFENVSKLFDHAVHNGSNYLNGHCFVSVMLCVPVWNRDKVSYLSVPSSCTAVIWMHPFYQSFICGLYDFFRCFRRNF